LNILQIDVSLLYLCVHRSFLLGLWTKPNCLVNGTNTTVKGLEEGKKYAFRVKAANIYGTSEPLESTTVTAKNPFGNLIYLNSLCSILCEW